MRAAFGKERPRAQGQRYPCLLYTSYHHFLDAYEGRTGRPQFAVFDLDGTLLDSMWVWDLSLIHI